MQQVRFNLSITEEEFDRLPVLEQEIVQRLSREHPAAVVPPRKELRFTMLETPESASRRMDQTNDVGEGFDVTEFSNPPKPRNRR